MKYGVIFSHILFFFLFSSAQTFDVNFCRDVMSGFSEDFDDSGDFEEEKKSESFSEEFDDSGDFEEKEKKEEPLPEEPLPEFEETTFSEEEAPPEDEASDFIESGEDFEEDDIVVEKRERELYEYVEPDIGIVLKPAYIYSDKNSKSTKVVPLYEDDEVAILEEDVRWYRVEFLGKEGWVKKQSVAVDKFYNYTLTAEFNSGIGYSAGLENYSLLTDNDIRILYEFMPDISAGVELKLNTINAEVAYGGFGVTGKYYLPFLQTKKGRSSVAATLGYLQIPDRPSYTSSAIDSIILRGAYATLSGDYLYAFSSRLYIGGGIALTYNYAVGELTETIERDFLLMSAHIKVLFNIFDK